MKKFLLFTSIVLLTTSSIYSQDYKVVFDLTSKDSVNQQSLVRQLAYIRQTNPAAQLEVVIYGEGLGFVVKDKSTQLASISQLIESDHISFKVCAATMKRYDIDKTQLISGVETVPDGIYEIITKQQQGWGYIKVAH